MSFKTVDLNQLDFEILFYISDELLYINYHIWVEFINSGFPNSEEIFNTTATTNYCQKFWREKYLSLENVPRFEKYREFKGSVNYYNLFSYHLGRHFGPYEDSSRYLAKVCSIEDIPSIISMLKKGVKVNTHILEEVAKIKNHLLFEVLYSSFGKMINDNIKLSMIRLGNIDLISKYIINSPDMDNFYQRNQCKISTKIMENGDLVLFKLFYRKLLQYSQNHEETIKDGLSYSMMYGRKEIFEYLLNEYQPFNKKPNLNLGELLSSNNVQFVEECLSKYYDSFDSLDKQDLEYCALWAVEYRILTLLKKCGIKKPLSSEKVRKAVIASGNIKYLKKHFNLDNFVISDLEKAYVSGNRKMFDFIYEQCDKTIENYKFSESVFPILSGNYDVEMFDKLMAIDKLKQELFLSNSNFDGDYNALMGIWMLNNCDQEVIHREFYWLIQNLPVERIKQDIIPFISLPGQGDVRSKHDRDISKRNSDTIKNMINYFLENNIECLHVLIDGLREKYPQITKCGETLDFEKLFTEFYQAEDLVEMKYILDMKDNYYLYRIITIFMSTNRNNKDIDLMLYSYISKIKAEKPKGYLEFFGFVLDRVQLIQLVNSDIDLDLVKELCIVFDIDTKGRKKGKLIKSLKKLKLLRSEK